MAAPCSPTRPPTPNPNFNPLHFAATNELISYTPAGIQTLVFTFNDGSLQTIGPAQTSPPDKSITFATNEMVTGLQILSSQVLMSLGHLGFPYFGGFIITTSAGQNVTFQPSGAATTTIAQKYGAAFKDGNAEYLASGFLCGMYGWTMASWEVLNSMHQVSPDTSFAAGVERGYGLADLSHQYYDGSSW